MFAWNTYETSSRQLCAILSQMAVAVSLAINVNFWHGYFECIYVKV